MLNLGNQSYKFSISCKIGKKSALSKFFDLSYRADTKRVWEVRDHLNVYTQSKRLQILCTDCPSAWSRTAQSTPKCHSLYVCNTLFQTSCIFWFSYFVNIIACKKKLKKITHTRKAATKIQVYQQCATFVINCMLLFLRTQRVLHCVPQKTIQCASS